MTTNIQYIRNATMKINYAGKTILTDPMLAEKEAYSGFLYRDRLANPTAERPLSIKEIIEDVDTLLVSHSHVPADGDGGPSDHFDAVAIDVLNKTLPLYIQAVDVDGMKRVGFDNVKAIEKTIQLDEIKITRFDGLHSDKEAFLPMVGQVSGYVLEAKDAPTILWTGDTLLTSEVKDAVIKHKPNIIIVHAGGAQMPIDADGNMVKLVMDAEDTIQLAKLAPEATLIAIHMEALDHCPVTRKELREKANQAGISSDRLIIPDDGEMIHL